MDMQPVRLFAALDYSEVAGTWTGTLYTPVVISELTGTTLKDLFHTVISDR